jgi:nitroreductase
MDALEALTTRRSAGQLAEPAPDDRALDAMFRAALRAPDHGRLRPWRFLVLRGAARERFGAVLADALGRRDATATPPLMERERQKPLRAPLMVIVAAKTVPSPKVPAIEQVVAAGAAAQNIMLAAHAMGFGAMWRTGEPAYDAHVKAALGLAEDDTIIGFLYLGTPVGNPPHPPAPEPAQFVTEWQGS